MIPTGFVLASISVEDQCAQPPHSMLRILGHSCVVSKPALGAQHSMALLSRSGVGGHRLDGRGSWNPVIVSNSLNDSS